MRFLLVRGHPGPHHAYEYMNKFYVEEGNKRVSVMKYYEAMSIPGSVTRIAPRRSEDKEKQDLL